MFERQLTDDEFRHWRDPAAAKAYSASRSHQVLESPLYPLCQFLGLIPVPAVNPRQAKRKSKERWTAFDSPNYGIAVNINGTVVVKGSTPREFQLWIRPDGKAGTNSKNKLTGDQIVNEWMIKILKEVIDTGRVWMERAEGRKFPPGPYKLLESASKDLAFLKEILLSHDSLSKWYL